MSLIDKIIRIEVISPSEVVSIEKENIVEVDEDTIRFDLDRRLSLYDFVFEDREINRIAGKVTLSIEGSIVPRVFEKFSDFKITRLEPKEIYIDEIESFELDDRQASDLQHLIAREIVTEEIIIDDFEIKVMYDLQVK